MRCLLPAAILAAVAGCRADIKADAKTGPATVTNPPRESALTTITLTEDAVRRLGIEVAPVTMRAVPRTRTLGGEVVVPPGLAVTVTAPMAGTVLAPPGGSPPAGSSVRRGDAVFRLVLLPGDKSIAGAEEELAAAAARARLAEQRWRRADQMYKDALATQDEADAAHAEYVTAEAAARAARARLALLVSGEPTDTAGLQPLNVIAPVAGVIWRSLVAPGQTVSSGAPLFEVARIDSLWVRVPVYVGDVPSVLRGGVARVVPLNAEGPGLTARPVTAPPTADPLAASADLFYAVRNAGRPLRPGQRVAVEVPLRGEQKGLTVPWSAVVHDIHGGTWAYEQTGPATYVRRRVEVRRVAGDLAVLGAGLAEGAQVVVAGVAELYGAEFGNGK